jgi:hypothetical protein
VDGPRVLVLEERDGALRTGDGAVLEAVSERTMRLGGAAIEFGADGVPARARVTGANIRPRTYERVARMAPTVARLGAFVGRYRSDEADVSFDLVVDGGTLSMRRAPDEAWALTPLFADAFASPIGTLRFTRDAAGAVTSMHVATDRAWDVVFTKEGRAGARAGRP